MVYFFLGLGVFFSFSSYAGINCEAVRGEEVIELTIHDTFVGKVAKIHRTHPLVTYRPKELPVQEKLNPKSVVISNKTEQFRLKIMNELETHEDGSSYYSGDLKFEDIRARMRCDIDN